MDEFFFLVQIVFMNLFFFLDVKALHDIFSTALLSMLKKCKASHSLITVLLKVTVSLESSFLRNSSIAIIEKEVSYYKRVSHLMPRGTFFHLSRKLGFVVLAETILYR